MLFSSMGLLAVSAAASTGAPISTMKITSSKRPRELTFAELKSYWWLDESWLNALDDDAVAQLQIGAPAAATQLCAKGWPGYKSANVLRYTRFLPSALDLKTKVDPDVAKISRLLQPYS